MCSPSGGSSCIREDLEYEAKGREALPTGGWLLVGVWSCVASDTLGDMQRREAMVPRLLLPYVMAGLHMILGVSFKARCPPYTSSWGPYLDLERGVTDAGNDSPL